MYIRVYIYYIYLSRLKGMGEGGDMMKRKSFESG
jgi:hypothetical protein